MFETHKKSIIQRVYILRRQNFIKKCQKWFILTSFSKPEA